MFHLAQKCIIGFILSGVICGSFVLPPKIKTPELPVCTSSAGLCGLDYRFVTENDVPTQMLHSRNKICTCPNGDVCALSYNWENMTNSVVQRMLAGSGHELLVKISYCQLPETQSRCAFEESILITRGRGLFTFDIVGNLTCMCRRPLVPKFSWSDGAYDYIQYGCGQRKCVQEQTSTCAEVSLKDGNLKNKYFCRCRQEETCTGKIPFTDGESVFHSCGVF